MRSYIDVLIPTAKQRLNNLLFNIRGILLQELPTRITVASTGEYPELMDALSDIEKASIRLITDAPAGAWGNAASKYAMENLDWHDWFYSIGDDDAILPWGLKNLWDNKENVSMVIGRALAVGKNGQKDLTEYRIGSMLGQGRVSGVCALFNFRDIEKLGKPYWVAESPVSDWWLINRMANTYKYRIIPNTVCALALATTE